MSEPRWSLPGGATRKILRAIREFALIEPGDNVLVGLSGGKDSSLLLYALSVLQRHRIIPFTVGALHIDLGFETPFDPAPLADYCDRLGVSFYLQKTEIAKYAFGEKTSEGSCATCSFLRRGAMNRLAKEHGYNVVTLAHHYDDAVETFLMSIIYSGQVKTFLPRTDLERSGLRVIRPLVYFRETEIRELTILTGFTPLPSPCPRDGHTKRAEVKELIRNLSRHDQRIFNNLASAMRNGRPQELWPAELAAGAQRHADRSN